MKCVLISIRQVERQVALVRIGAAEGSTLGLSSQAEVDEALRHSMPSELMLKGSWNCALC
jgi:hypothetical protein